MDLSKNILECNKTSCFVFSWFSLVYTERGEKRFMDGTQRKLQKIKLSKKKILENWII